MLSTESPVQYLAHEASPGGREWEGFVEPGVKTEVVMKCESGETDGKKYLTCTTVVSQK